MRTRLYCSALLPPCMGVLIAQATGGNELQCLLPAVYVYPVCSYMSVQYTMQYRRPYSKLTGVIFLVFRANESRSGRGARGTFPRRACMSGALRSLCPFPFARLKNAKKITPVLWERFTVFIRISAQPRIRAQPRISAHPSPFHSNSNERPQLKTQPPFPSHPTKMNKY